MADLEQEIKEIVSSTIKKAVQPVLFPDIQKIEMVNKDEPNTELFEELIKTVAKITLLKGPMGSQGPKGEKGDSIKGEKGKDGKDGTGGKDGKDGSIVTKEELLDKLDLDIDSIMGLKEVLEELRTRKLGGRVFGPSVIIKNIYNQTPTGAVNGSNTAFVLPKAPINEMVYLNGVRMRSGSSNDYTLANRTITFNTAPLTDDIILVDIDF